MELKERKIPKGIICLVGLNIQEEQDNIDNFEKNKFGIKIFHKYNIYPKKLYYFDTEFERSTFMKHVSPITEKNVQDLYEFKQQIGIGQFSRVLICLHTQENKEYAVKIINKTRISLEIMEMLIYEVEMLRFLNHPGIIKVKDTIETNDTIFIILELIKGGDLFDFVHKNEFLQEFKASFIMKQLMETISYIHKSGVIHRDLKPENIMIISDEKNSIKQIKIIDFGTSIFLTPGEQMTGQVVGTPNYISPEILDVNEYDEKADVFSLGCIMYYMISGTLPFDSYELDEIIEKTKNGKYDSENDFFNNVSKQGKELISQMLCVEPENRISLESALKHPWIKKRDFLKDYINKNPKKSKFCKKFK